MTTTDDANQLEKPKPAGYWSVATVASYTRPFPESSFPSSEPDVISNGMKCNSTYVQHTLIPHSFLHEHNNLRQETEGGK